MYTEKFKINGFMGAAVESGLKKHGGLDFALIYSERECAAAGVFTTNTVKAAPVLISMDRISSGRAAAIVVNAGNANACNGNQGIHDAMRTAELIAAKLEISPDKVLIASTGVIGSRLDMNCIEKSVPGLVKTLHPDGLTDVSRAIMTTDSFSKTGVRTVGIGGKICTICGMAKGAGMIMPNMATMLCFILTDLNIEQTMLNDILKTSVDRTFNRITVDGDTSTNDTVFILANGAAENSKSLTPHDADKFKTALISLLEDLSRMIVKDGEGATKLVKIEVRGARTPEDAEKAARTIANSNLVKTALFGCDPNWGRIMAALGRSGIIMDERRIKIEIGGIEIVSEGTAVPGTAESEAAAVMKTDEYDLTIDLGMGFASDFILTCDLTHEYININADYRS